MTYLMCSRVMDGKIPDSGRSETSARPFSKNTFVAENPVSPRIICMPLYPDMVPILLRTMIAFCFFAELIFSGSLCATCVTPLKIRWAKL